MIVAVVVGVAVLAGAGYFFVSRQGGSVADGPSDRPSQAASDTPTSGASDAPDPPSAGPTPTGAPSDGATDDSTNAPVLPVEGQVVTSVDDVLEEQVGTYRAGRRINGGLADTGASDSAEIRYNQDPARRQTRILHTIGIYESDSAARDRVRSLADSLAPPFVLGEEQELTDAEGNSYGVLVTLNNEAGALTFVLWSNRNAYFSLGGGAGADLEAFYNNLPY